MEETVSKSIDFFSTVLQNYGMPYLIIIMLLFILILILIFMGKFINKVVLSINNISEHLSLITASQKDIQYNIVGINNKIEDVNLKLLKYEIESEYLLKKEGRKQ